MASQPVLSKAVSSNYMATLTALIVVKEPIAGQAGQLLMQQPSVMAVGDEVSYASIA
ncbi:hypothetical protein scyTo_0025964, partial [Scyliorhinus torazame]|nr:hypothetical protein [Scyliorhinus torazame]